MEDSASNDQPAVLGNMETVRPGPFVGPPIGDELQPVDLSTQPSNIELPQIKVADGPLFLNSGDSMEASTVQSNSEPLTLNSTASILSSATRSVETKLDSIARKLMDGLTASSSKFSEEKPILSEGPVSSSCKVFVQDEEAVQPEDIADSIGTNAPLERPFSELLPPPHEDSQSQPEFVQELVSENVPLDFSEVLDENNSAVGSLSGGSVAVTPVQVDSPSASVPEPPETSDSHTNQEEAKMDIVDEGSNAEFDSKATSEPEGAKEDQHTLSAEQVFEYQWPPERGGDIFMIQEQVSEFLEVLSFKRKYPDLTRRPVEYKERIFLMDRGVVSEVQCDLGLTALRSEEVCELMARDYAQKYKEYIDALRERERKRISEENKGYSMQNMEKAKMEFLMKKAVRSAATFNAQFMQEKREERRAYFDLQTFEIQFPRSRFKSLPPEMTKVDAYPVALIPGQYQDFYKSYTPQELKYFPIKTALYSPHRSLSTIYADPSQAEDRDSADEGKDDGSSSSDNSGSGSSDSEPDSIEVEVVKNPISEEQIKKLLSTPRPDTPPKKIRRRQTANTPDASNDGDKDSGRPTPTATRGRPRKTAQQTRTPARRGPRKNGAKAGQANAEKCNICLEVTAQGVAEEVVQCFECKKHVHPSCAELTAEMIPIIRTYPWQCMECKSCVKCKDAQDEEKMMFCDLCDRGYHTYCVGLTSIPEGRWECPSCTDDSSLQKRKGRQK